MTGKSTKSCSCISLWIISITTTILFAILTGCIYILWTEKTRIESRNEDLNDKLENFLRLIELQSSTTTEYAKNMKNTQEQIKEELLGRKKQPTSLYINSKLGVDTTTKGIKVSVEWGEKVIGMLNPECNLIGSNLPNELVEIRGNKEILNLEGDKIYKYKLTCKETDTETETENIRNQIQEEISVSTNIHTPILISDCTQLQSIGDSQIKLTKNYYLSENIDCNGQAFQPIDRNFEGFYGSINGFNYSIGNITISSPNADRIGIIGLCYGCTFINIKVENPSISGNESTACVIGKAISATIENVHVIGGVITGFKYTGGIVGEAKYTNIKYSSAEVTMNAKEFYVGGIAGSVEHTNITESYTKGSIANTTTVAGDAGGIVGSMTFGSQISDCYSLMNINFDYRAGGVVGNQYMEGTLTMRSYSVGTVSGSAFDSPTIGQNVGPAGAKYILGC